MLGHGGIVLGFVLHTLSLGKVAAQQFVIVLIASAFMRGLRVTIVGGQAEGIWDMRNEYDAVYNFHHDFRGFGSPLNPDVMPNLIHCLEMILDGTVEYRQIPDALSDCGATKTVAMYKDVFVSCIGHDIEKVI